MISICLFFANYPSLTPFSDNEKIKLDRYFVMRSSKETNTQVEFNFSGEKESFNHEFTKVDEIKMNKSKEFASFNSPEYNQTAFSNKKKNKSKNKIRDVAVRSGISFGTVSVAGVVVTAVGVVALTATAVAAVIAGVSLKQVNTGISYIKCALDIKNISFDDLLFYAENVDDATDYCETNVFLNDDDEPYVVFRELKPDTTYAVTAKVIEEAKTFKLGTYSTLEVPYYNVNINLDKSTLYSMTFDVEGAEGINIEALVYNENNLMIDSKTFYDGVVSFGNLQPTEIYTLHLFQEGFEVANRTFATSIIVPEYEIVFRELGSTHIGVSLIYDYNQETSFSLTLLQDGMYAGQLGADGGVYYYNDLIPGTTYILRLSNFSTSVIEDIEFQSVPIPEGIYSEEAENLGDSVTYNLYNLPDDSDLVFTGILYKTETGEEIEQISVYRDTFTFGIYGGLEPVTSYYFDVVFEHYRLDEPIFITSGEFKTTFFQITSRTTYRSFEYCVENPSSYGVDISKVYAEILIDGITETYVFEHNEAPDTYTILIEGLQDDTEYTLHFFINENTRANPALYDYVFKTDLKPTVASFVIDEITWDTITFTYDFKPEKTSLYISIYDANSKFWTGAYYSGNFQEALYGFMPLSEYRISIDGGIDLEFQLYETTFTTPAAPPIERVDSTLEFTFANSNRISLTAQLFEESDITGEYTTLIESVEIDSETGFAFTIQPTTSTFKVAVCYTEYMEEEIASQIFTLNMVR